MTKSTSDNSKSSKRKGTRSVSTLTPAQLARKRANDREAQRAIRARTKEHIENLERELEELRSASSRDDTVQDLLRKNRALEEELHRLKESMGIATNGPRSYYQPSYHSPTSRTSAPSHVADYSGMEMGAYDTLSSPGDAWPSNVPSTIPSTVSSPSSSGATDDLGTAYYPTSAPSIMDRPVWVRRHQARHRMPAAQHALNPTSIPAAAVEHVPNVLHSVASPMRNAAGAGYWETPGLITAPMTQSDALLNGYIQDCRRLVAMGGMRPHPEVIFGPACPNIRRLIETHWNLASIVQQSTLSSSPPAHPLVELAATLFDNDNLVMTLERVGSFVLLQRLLAWLIQPTQETSGGLGSHLVPTPAQRSVPHGQWVDFLLWAQLRDTVVQRLDVYANTEFRHLYNTSLRLVNFAGGPSQALVPDYSSGAIYLTQAFVNHVLNIGNWALEERRAIVRPPRLMSQRTSLILNLPLTKPGLRVEAEKARRSEVGHHLRTWPAVNMVFLWLRQGQGQTDPPKVEAIASQSLRVPWSLPYQGTLTIESPGGLGVWQQVQSTVEVMAPLDEPT
ncbi:bZIP transcription factor [Seiridium cupressi]